MVGGCLVVNLGTPWVEWTDGEEADQLLGREGLVLVKVMLCEEGRQEIKTSLNTTKLGSTRIDAQKHEPAKTQQ